MEKRNLKEGDIGVIKDSNLLRGEWRLAKVTCTYPDRNNRVRNVEHMVKPKQGGGALYVPTAPIYIKRHVSNVVLLVPADDNIDQVDDTSPTTTGFRDGV